jgi:hypothetical protein
MIAISSIKNVVCIQRYRMEQVPIFKSILVKQAKNSVAVGERFKFSGTFLGGSNFAL